MIAKARKLLCGDWFYLGTDASNKEWYRFDGEGEANGMIRTYDKDTEEMDVVV